MRASKTLTKPSKQKNFADILQTLVEIPMKLCLLMIFWYKQTASWQLPTVIQNVMLNECLKTVHHWSAFRGKEMQSTYCENNPKYILNIILTLMAMTSTGYHFHIATQISNGTWHPQHNTKQEIVQCNITVSFLGAINSLKVWAATITHTHTHTPKPYLLFSPYWLKRCSF